MGGNSLMISGFLLRTEVVVVEGGEVEVEMRGDEERRSWHHHLLTLLLSNREYSILYSAEYISLPTTPVDSTISIYRRALAKTRPI